MDRWAALPLSTGGVSKIDASDFDALSRHKWRKSKFGRGNPYVIRSTGGRVLLLHRELVGAGPGQIVDHINRDTLDNRRENLRLCTIAENSRNTVALPRHNTSGFRGVCRMRQRWAAMIKVAGRQVFLGTFVAPEDAARAYDKAAALYHGDFATLNFGGTPQ